MIKKNEFINLGMDDELATKCESLVTEKTKNAIPYDRFKEVNEEKANLKEQVKGYEKQLETLKNSNIDTDNLKDTINQLQAENKLKEKEYQSQIKEIKMNNAIDTALTNANVINNKTILPLLNLGLVELLEDGQIRGLTEQIEKLSSSEDTKFLFKQKEEAKISGVTPSNSNNISMDNNINPKNMTYSELVQYANDNPDVKLNLN